jgi:hypothetical protein
MINLTRITHIMPMSASAADWEERSRRHDCLLLCEPNCTQLVT